MLTLTSHVQHKLKFLCWILAGYNLPCTVKYAHENEYISTEKKKKKHFQIIIEIHFCHFRCLSAIVILEHWIPYHNKIIFLSILFTHIIHNDNNYSEYVGRRESPIVWLKSNSIQALSKLILNTSSCIISVYAMILSLSSHFRDRDIEIQFIALNKLLNTDYLPEPICLINILMPIIFILQN